MGAGLDDVSRDGLFLDTGMLSRELPKRHPRPRSGRAGGAQPLLARSAPTVADLSRDGKQLLLYEEGSNPERPDEEVFTTYPAPDRRLGREDRWAKAGRWRFRPTGSGRSSRARLPNRIWFCSRRAPASRGGFRAAESALPAGALLSRRKADPVHRAADKDGNCVTYIQDLEGGPPKPFGEAGRWALLVSPDGREIVGGDDEQGLMIYPGGRPGEPPADQGNRRGRPSAPVELRRQDDLRSASKTISP